MMRQHPTCADVAPTPAVPRKGLARLHGEGKRLGLAEGHVLVREGAFADDVFVVVEGTVMLFKSLPDRRRQVVGFRLADEPVMPTRAGAPWPVTVQAVTRCQLSRLPCHAFRGLVESDPDIRQTLLDWAGDEIAARQAQLLTVGRKDTSERVAAFILEIAGRGKGPPAQSEAVMLVMNRTAIADYLGLKTETVSRAFTRLINQRLLALPRPNHVVILDRPTLQAVANGHKPIPAKLRAATRHESASLSRRP